MTGLLDWLASLPDPLLYGAIVLAAFAENIFPPLPADTVVALGAFVAARGNGTAVGAWTATMIGNIAGAMTMYWVGRRFGFPWLAKRLRFLQDPGAAGRFESTYKRYGLPGIALSRFLPAVRAVVPPLAGAFRIGPWRAFAAMTIASAVWYGAICWLAFRAGANADVLLERIADNQRLAALIAGALLLCIAAAWFVRQRRKVRDE